MLICSSAYDVGISSLLVAFLQVILVILNPDSKKQLIFLLWFIIIDQSADNTFLLLAHCTAAAKVTNLILFRPCREDITMAPDVQMFFLWADLHMWINPAEVTGITHVNNTVLLGIVTLGLSSAGNPLTFPVFMTHIFKGFQTIYINNHECWESEPTWFVVLA